MKVRLEKKSAEGYIMTAGILKTYTAKGTLYQNTC